MASSQSETAANMTSTPKDDMEETFTLFPKLPIELRLKIWGFTLPGPRLIDTSLPSRYYQNYVHGKYPRNPVTTKICQESREVALKKFEQIKQGGYIRWVDFEVDYFVARKFFWHITSLPKADWPKVRNMVMDASDFEGTINMRCVMKRLHFSGFCGGTPNNLEHVVILDEDFYEAEDDEMTMINGSEVRKLQFIKSAIEDPARPQCTLNHGLPSPNTSYTTTPPVVSFRRIYGGANERRGRGSGGSAQIEEITLPEIKGRQDRE